MSTIKVNKIENTSTTDGGISIDNSGHVTVDGQQIPSEGPLSNRNLFENGAMRVAQRGNSKTGITGAIENLNVDRTKLATSSLGTWTSTSEQDGPAGFVRSLKLNCTTADASPASTDYAIARVNLEAVNLQPLEYGTADAKAMTISFYVKSNKIGNASLELIQSDNSNKMYSTSYEIEEEDTWEYKTITIPGDTAGLINDDTGTGIAINFWLNSGSSYTSGSLSNAWQALNQPDRNCSNLGVGGAVNDNWSITGLQIEIGEKATPFEHLNYGDYLHKCQRYYLKGPAVAIYGQRWAGDDTFVVWNFPVQMRDTPTITGTFNIGSGTLSTNFTDKNMMQQYIDGYVTGSLAANAEFSAEL